MRKALVAKRPKEFEQTGFFQEVAEGDVQEVAPHDIFCRVAEELVGQRPEGEHARDEHELSLIGHLHNVGTKAVNKHSTEASRLVEPDVSNKAVCDACVEDSPAADAELIVEC